MKRNTGVYWSSEETAARAKELAGKRSVSAYLSQLVDEQWAQLNPEPPISATCPTCGQDTTFVFVAYWEEQSDLYRCSNCQKVTQYDTIMNNGHKAKTAEKEAINE